MTPRESQAVSKAIQTVLARTLMAEARCDALQATVALLADMNGLNAAQVMQAIDRAAKIAFQKRLEQVEQLDPSLAAKLDPRPEQLDIADFLDP
jgi:hypothetical protein